MLKYLILTIGCQMNKSDSERLAAVLENIRFAQTEKEAEANLIFVNACSVRQSAIDRIFGKKKKWNKRRETGDLKTFLLGCVLPKDKPKMENFFDAIFDIKDIVNLPKILRKSGVKFKQSKKNGQNKFAPDSDYFHLAPSNSSKVSAFVPIMRGCDHFCAYCAVPYAKGPEISRPARDIANEAKKYIKQGFKEITLLGQNVNSYGLIRPRWKMVDEKTKKIYPPESWILDTKSSKPPFVQLLEEIDKIPGKFWIRFITSHPMDMSLDLIKAVAAGEHITPYIHLPAQSGNDEMLKKMNRQYTIEWYKKIIENIRKYIPDAVISTDIIVGFPDETKKQFRDTMDLFDFARYDIAYIAKYSPRPGTAATHYKDNVPMDEKKRREKILTKKLSEIALARNQKLVGKKIEVLVESIHGQIGFGHTREFRGVKFPYSGSIGEFVKVKITKANPWGLMGEFK